jgi:predicted transposase/invertase (TIGR01784 family)
MSRYINPYTDFGFKKLFGEEANKDLLTDFLNTLLPRKHQIKTLKFLNTEQLGVAPEDRRAVFDVYCENSKKEPFIVEMQKAEQEYFKDRSVYYISWLIRQQSQKGKKWNYELKNVYFFGILDFVYEKKNPNPVLIRDVSFKDQLGKEFYEKLKMTYIQMPLFNKAETELETRQDKWLYFLKNLPSLNQIPAIMKEKVFKKAFHTAEVASMDPKEQFRYEQDLNIYWTNFAVMDTAKKQGRRQGRRQGRQEGIKIGHKKGLEEGIVLGHAEGETQKATDIARSMKQEGFKPAVIAKITGLSQEEIKLLD